MQTRGKQRNSPRPRFQNQVKDLLVFMLTSGPLYHPWNSYSHHERQCINFFISVMTSVCQFKSEQFGCSHLHLWWIPKASTLAPFHENNCCLFNPWPLFFLMSLLMSLLSPRHIWSSFFKSLLSSPHSAKEVKEKSREEEVEEDGGV